MLIFPLKPYGMDKGQFAVYWMLVHDINSLLHSCYLSSSAHHLIWWSLYCLARRQFVYLHFRNFHPPFFYFLVGSNVDFKNAIGCYCWKLGKRSIIYMVSGFQRCYRCEAFPLFCLRKTEPKCHIYNSDSDQSPFEVPISLLDLRQILSVRRVGKWADACVHYP
jgi:hypothetical protein